MYNVSVKSWRVFCETARRSTLWRRLFSSSKWWIRVRSGCFTNELYLHRAYMIAAVINYQKLCIPTSKLQVDPDNRLRIQGSRREIIYLKSRQTINLSTRSVRVELRSYAEDDNLKIVAIKVSGNGKLI